MIACNCLGIGEDTLREHLNKAARPVKHKEVHRELGGAEADCCHQCRSPHGDRYFVQIVNDHNSKHKSRAS
jgi:bacterioferritin-associated ferredoxin